MTSVAIVTGAGRGMGYACAERLADTIDHLLLIDLDEATVTAAAIALAGHRATIEPVVLDITDVDGVQRLADQAAGIGQLRAVAHAAGISPTMADWRRIFGVDLIGTALLLEALRPLAGAGTAIVCFASMAATLGVTAPDPAVLAVLDDPLADDFLDRLHGLLGASIEDSGLAYAWAKFAVQRFAAAEAVRLGPVGGRVCSLSPGIIDTPQGQQEAAAQDVMKVLVERTPLGRVGHADEVAAVTAFLLSDAASFVSGIDVRVDGGVCAALLGSGNATG